MARRGSQRVLDRVSVTKPSDGIIGVGTGDPGVRSAFKSGAVAANPAVNPADATFRIAPAAGGLTAGPLVDDTDEQREAGSKIGRNSF
jgi:hypothetical protein